MLTCIYLQKYYTSKYYAPLCHSRSGTLTHMSMLSVTVSTKVPHRVQSTTTSKAATRNLQFLPDKLYLSSVTPGSCGFLPPSSAQPMMAPTCSKSLVVDSTDVFITTFKNIIWMLSNKTHPTLAT